MARPKNTKAIKLADQTNIAATLDVSSKDVATEDDISTLKKKNKHMTYPKGHVEVNEEKNMAAKRAEYAEWACMSKAQRKAKGFPTNDKDFAIRLGVHWRTLYNWRNAPDVRRYIMNKGVVDWTSLEDVEAIWKGQILKAINGDTQASKMVLDRCGIQFKNPMQADEPDEEEMRLLASQMSDDELSEALDEEVIPFEDYSIDEYVVGDDS